MELYVGGMFAMFVSMLVGLLLFHHHKLPVVAIGFAILSVAFISHGGLEHWMHHFAEHHRSHLLINLALLLPAFALVAYYFEHSGASNGLAKMLTSDAALLWVVFFLSTVLDNIAAAMIGGTIILAKYGMGNVPFSMIVGVIGSSNLGGAGSPVGDTTTVMMYISEDPKIYVSEIFMAFIATIPAQFVLTLWAVRHGVAPQSAAAAQVVEEQHVLVHAAHASSDGAHTGAAEAEGLITPHQSVQWAQMWPMLAIPGLVIGNLQDQPGLGVWAGLIIGLIFAMRKFEFKIFREALPNTGFLLLLVGAAEMLPLDNVKPMLEMLPRDAVAIIMGHLSAWFDNIPLTAICLALKGFDWGLLAFCVGYGGSAMWFGSSAGVAIGLLFPEVYNTKKWGMPFVVITLTYWIGTVSYLLVKHTLPLATEAFAAAPNGMQMLVCLAGTFACWAAAGACWMYPQQRVSLARKVGAFVLGGAGAVSLFCAFWVITL
jgi:Na+/H+ antiporter NhaD/arsenite permease-like protein